MYSPVPCYLWLTDSLTDCLTDSCDMTWKQLLWRPWVPWTLGSDVPLVMFSINGQIMNFCVWADWICHFISAFLILCCVILLFLYYLVPATRSISIFGMRMVGQKSSGRVGYRDPVRAWTQKRLQSHTALGGEGSRNSHRIRHLMGRKWHFSSKIIIYVCNTSYKSSFLTAKFLVSVATVMKKKHLSTCQLAKKVCYFPYFLDFFPSAHFSLVCVVELVLW